MRNIFINCGLFALAWHIPRDFIKDFSVDIYAVGYNREMSQSVHKWSKNTFRYKNNMYRSKIFFHMILIFNCKTTGRCKWRRRARVLEKEDALN
mgnify:CR=1 FL=1